VIFPRDSVLPSSPYQPGKRGGWADWRCRRVRAWVVRRRDPALLAPSGLQPRQSLLIASCNRDPVDPCRSLSVGILRASFEVLELQCPWTIEGFEMQSETLQQRCVFRRPRREATTGIH